MFWERVISFLGIFFILGIAWLLSNNKKKIQLRVITWGLALQLIFAFLILKTRPGIVIFDGFKAVVVQILSFTDEGAGFLFGNLYRANAGIIKNISASNMQGHVLLLDSAAKPTVELGAAVVGKVDTFQVRLQNQGAADLILKRVTFTDSLQFQYLLPGLPVQIPPRGSLFVQGQLIPNQAGGLTTAMIFQTNGLIDSTVVQLTATATITPQPELKVAANLADRSQFKDLGIIFAFHILPTIIFFAALMGVLYHYGIMQRIVQFMAWIMARSMGTSGAESLSAASNIFVGQTEAPLVIKPYVAKMTESELIAIMTGGFATIAGGVMAAYVRFGVDAGHIMAASVMSAPAALVIAKIVFPERGQPETMGNVKLQVEKTTSNVIDAAATGAGDGLRLAVNVGAMLMAFLSLIALFNFVLGHLDELINFFTFHHTKFNWNLSLKQILGYLFAPFAFFMGVSFQDILAVGHLLGTKISINELVAYMDLVHLKETISPRSFTIATYALCGFANFGSIAIQIGGISSIAPSRRSDLARLGFRAMIAGALASWLTATIAGLLI